MFLRLRLRAGRTWAAPSGSPRLRRAAKSHQGIGRLADQLRLFAEDLSDDPMIALAPARVSEDRREWREVGPNLPTQPSDPVNTRHRSIQMPARPVQSAAALAQKIIEIDIPNGPFAPGALPQKAAEVIVHHANFVSIQQKHRGRGKAATAPLLEFFSRPKFQPPGVGRALIGHRIRHRFNPCRLGVGQRALH